MSPRRFKHNEPTAIGKEQCCRHVRPNSKNYLTKTRWNHWTISASYAAIAKLRLRHYAKLRRKYTKLRRSYAKIRRKYAKKKINTFDSFDRGCAEKKVAVQTCEWIHTDPG